MFKKETTQRKVKLSSQQIWLNTNKNSLFCVTHKYLPGLYKSDSLICACRSVLWPVCRWYRNLLASQCSRRTHLQTLSWTVQWHPLQYHQWVPVYLPTCLSTVYVCVQQENTTQRLKAILVTVSLSPVKRLSLSLTVLFHRLITGFT